MKQQINEFKRMQLIAGLITESEYRESLLNEDSLEKTISFGPYTNLTYYDHPREDTAYLVVDTSDNFTKIARAVDTKGKDFYTKKQILYLNDKLEDLADEMSDYLTKQGIENEVVDSPEGYGQEIDNLEIEISKDDLLKLGQVNKVDEAEKMNESILKVYVYDPSSYKLEDVETYSYPSKEEAQKAAVAYNWQIAHDNGDTDLSKEEYIQKYSWDDLDDISYDDYGYEIVK